MGLRHLFHCLHSRLVRNAHRLHSPLQKQEQNLTEKVTPNLASSQVCLDGFADVSNASHKVANICKALQESSYGELHVTSTEPIYTIIFLTYTESSSGWVMGRDYTHDAALITVDFTDLNSVFNTLIPPSLHRYFELTACFYAIDVMMLDGWFARIP